MADAAALSFLLMSDERSSRLRRRYSDPCVRDGYEGELIDADMRILRIRHAHALHQSVCQG
jgi:hypothetical protein